MGKFKKIRKLLNNPLPPCIKDKVMKIIKDIKSRENTDGNIQIREEQRKNKEPLIQFLISSNYRKKSLQFKSWRFFCYF